MHSNYNSLAICQTLASLVLLARGIAKLESNCSKVEYTLIDFKLRLNCENLPISVLILSSLSQTKFYFGVLIFVLLCPSYLFLLVI